MVWPDCLCASSLQLRDHRFEPPPWVRFRDLNNIKNTCISHFESMCIPYFPNVLSSYRAPRQVSVSALWLRDHGFKNTRKVKQLFESNNYVKYKAWICLCLSASYPLNFLSDTVKKGPTQKLKTGNFQTLILNSTTSYPHSLIPLPLFPYFR